MRKVIFTILAMLCCVSAFGQKGIGLRFASNINYFPKAIDYQFVTHAYTTGVFGVFFSSYQPRNGFELGFNLMYKNGKEGGFNLPVVMKDFNATGQRVGVSGIEMDLKVGPRFGAFNPKIGYILGYRFSSSGFQEEGADGEINRFYLMLPFGLSVNLPTNYGSVGFGSYYNVGIFNVLADPNPGNGAIHDGGRLRYVNFEITVTYDVDR